jgi:septal ring factor EnvC (AmiA/AmiB activator)
MFGGKMQPDSSLAQEPQTPLQAAGSVPEAPKPRRNIVIPILLVLLLLAASGVGYWAYQLNTQLTRAKQSLSALQAKHDTLKSEKSKLSTELDQVNSELADTNAAIEKTKSDSTAATAELSKYNDEASALISKMGKAEKYIEILKGAFADKDNVIETFLKVSAIKDSKLDSLWADYLASKSNSFVKFMAYIISTTVDILKN